MFFVHPLFKIALYTNNDKLYYLNFRFANHEKLVALCWNINGSLQRLLSNSRTYNFFLQSYYRFL